MFVELMSARMVAPYFGSSLYVWATVIGFTLREPRLTRERAAELAQVAAPLTAGLSDDAARTRLVGIGRFLMGRR